MSEVTYAIDNLNKTINQFESNVNVHVSTIRDGSINVEQATRSIYEQLTKFRQDMEHGELKQLAHENIIRIEQIIKERFGSWSGTLISTWSAIPPSRSCRMNYG